jgi:hypothetical protein
MPLLTARRHGVLSEGSEIAIVLTKEDATK